jgi:hypothetical protein
MSVADGRECAEQIACMIVFTALGNGGLGRLSPARYQGVCAAGHGAAGAADEGRLSYGGMSVHDDQAGKQKWAREAVGND